MLRMDGWVLVELTRRATPWSRDRAGQRGPPTGSVRQPGGTRLRLNTVFPIIKHRKNNRIHDRKTDFRALYGLLNSSHQDR
jgi:hypothetical protein